MIPRELASSARDRILVYLSQYPRTRIDGAELAVVAGIDDWPRRVRELRVELGWPIVSGVTAKEMFEQGELVFEDLSATTLTKDDYILLDTTQDREAAYRWHIAKTIRNSTGSAKEKILRYFRENVARSVTGEELRYVCKDLTEWGRRVRELRTEDGWHYSGRIDLPVGVYLLEQDRQSPPHDRLIRDEDRRNTLRRDNYQCQRCGWQHSMNNRSDPRHLELHHIEHHVDGGSNTQENLITLCTVCHDDWHSRDLPSEQYYPWLTQGKHSLGATRT